MQNFQVRGTTTYNNVTVVSMRSRSGQNRRFKKKNLSCFIERRSVNSQVFSSYCLKSHINKPDCQLRI